MISVDQNFNGQTVDLPVGQVMELRLAENPTTGYRWTFVRDGKPVCVVVADR
jgi:predicted secreted protein